MSDIKELNKKIKKISTYAINNFNNEIVNQIDNKYQNIISEFYAHYRPKRYDRTLNTRYASSGHFINRRNYRKVNITKSGDKGYIVGIHISTEYMDNKDPYNADVNWVFKRTFEKGIHGFCMYDIYNWNKKRRKNGEEQIKWDYTKNAYVRKKERKDSDKSYEKVERKYPPTFHPTPKVRMDKWFNNYRKDTSNLDSIMEKYIKMGFNKYMK